MSYHGMDIIHICRFIGAQKKLQCNNSAEKNLNGERVGNSARPHAYRKPVSWQGLKQFFPQGSNLSRQFTELTAGGIHY